MRADELIGNKLWVEDPSFLHVDETHWPANPVLKLPDNDPELKDVIKYVTQYHHSSVRSRSFDRYSSFVRLKKAVAYMLRARKLLVAKVKHPELPDMMKPLSVPEMNTAETAILKYVQAESLPETENGAKFQRHRALFCFEAQVKDGLFCAGRKAPVHQIILPRRHPVVNTIIRESLEWSAHMGRDYVFSVLRQKHWKLGARKIIKSIQKLCRFCRLKHPKLLVQKMADLPAEKLTIDKPPFSTPDMDYFGPFLARIGRR